jgi:hypothetical protein
MPGVSQISPPMRIVLGVAVAFLVVYMVALRPKAEVAPPAPATPAGNVATGKPAVTGMGKTAQAAQAAVAAANAASARTAGQAAAGADTGKAPATGTATGTATGSTAPPATAASSKATGLPLPVLKAVAKHQVLALLFWNPASADDQLVHAALKKVDRFDGEVFVHSAPIGRVSRYARITRGADVEQSPTVVVVDRKLRSTNLVGYVDALTIQQTVVDALRASGGLFTSAYLKRVNKSCSSAGHDMSATPQAMTPAQAPAALRKRVNRWDGFVADLRGTPAPKRFRSFNRSLIADATALQSLFHQQLRALGPHPTVARVAQVVTTLDHRTPPLAKRFSRHADKQHLVFCGSVA